ncbi:threonine-phosphate decarboxylase CobD [Paenibacillus brevis]|uniref:Threonine-phosphate decarboxylase CobD n=1 Tax=Paenibacillus brevis TaxID=2841508 RepID=A0ABS6FNP9_9BACL|nr:threonine-phosphate decarboxylase CobD [Paenibacillus brevis]MBU5671842.1 threonine-phosphate decarboxylase CobD [Paenibacillus brevis]
MLEIYGHGGDLHTASAKFGLAPKRFLDLSANINPLGPPPGVLELLVQALPSITAYPDPGHRGLVSRLSRMLGLEPECLVIGNGAAENMALALLAFTPAKVGVIEPCFSEYAKLAAKFGAEVMAVFGKEERDFKADPDDIVELISRCGLVFIGQPNNPNGVQYGLQELKSFAEAGERCNTVIVMDEAFIDFIPVERRQTLEKELMAYRNLILIRSMTKFYAIPGLRLGYAIAHPDRAAAMRNKQVTWSVNGLALLAGEACLSENGTYGGDTIAMITEQRARLRNGLAELGCRTWPGEANFLLVRLPEGSTAAVIQARLGERGILVRSCAMYPGLGSGDIRLAVKNPAACDRLLHELGDILERGDN